MFRTGKLRTLQTLGIIIFYRKFEVHQADLFIVRPDSKEDELN